MKQQKDAYELQIAGLRKQLEFVSNGSVNMTNLSFASTVAGDRARPVGSTVSGSGRTWMTPPCCTISELSKIVLRTFKRAACDSDYKLKEWENPSKNLRAQRRAEPFTVSYASMIPIPTIAARPLRSSFSLVNGPAAGASMLAV